MPQEKDPFSLSRALYDPELDDFKQESEEVVKLLENKQQELEFERTNKLYIKIEHLSKIIDYTTQYHYRRFHDLEKRLISIESKMDTILELLNGRK